MPVALGVAARAPVLEGDPVLTAPAPCGHGHRVAGGGDYGGDNGRTYRDIPRPAETRKLHVKGISAQAMAGQKKARWPCKEKVYGSIP